MARYNLEAVAARLEPALWPQLHTIGARRRLIDLASADTLQRSGDWLAAARLRETLPGVVWRFLEQERAEAVEGRAERVARLAPPPDPAARPVHAALLALRATIPPSIAPRPMRTLSQTHLLVDEALPGFRFADPLPYEATVTGAGFVSPIVELRLGAGDAPSHAECTCGAAACVHILAAIDTALAWLRQPSTDQFLATLTALGRPAWERTLDALDRALDDDPGTSAGFVLTWRLAVAHDVEVTVTPWVARLGRKRVPGVPARVGRRRLLLEHGPRLAPDDARVAALLPDRDGGAASRALLEALIDHPRLVSADDPELPVRIERASVGLVAEQRGGALRVAPGLDGATLPPALLDRVRRSRPEDVIFLYDARRLTLLDVASPVRALIGVLAEQGDVFPAESHDALLTRLAAWAQRIPIAMPKSVMGESAPARLAPVVRLAAQSDGSVEVELRVRPLDGGPTVIPGEGGRDVHVRRGGKAYHAVRDLRAEEAAIDALAVRLELELEGWRHRFPTAQGALALLAACARESPPPELEWVGRAVRSVGSRGARALELVVTKRREWFGVLGGLSVEGERVELARLLDSVRRRERFVQVDAHTYVELDAELRRHLERLAAQAVPTRNGLEVGPAAAPSFADLEADGVALAADAPWRTLAARILAAGELEPIVPVALAADLRPYQVDGFRWLTRLAHWGAGGVLADDMGLGKTLQALALLVDRAALGPALVVAPTSVAWNWRDEARRFAPTLRFVLHNEAVDRDAQLASLGAGDVLVVSYGLLVRDVESLRVRSFATIVFDEAQGLKNAGTQRFRAATRLDGAFKLALSGTPIENHLGELWSLFAAVFPGLLGPWEHFRDRHATPIERGLDPDAAPALARVISPFLLRRTKAEVEAELPARTEIRVPVVLSAAEWEMYEDARLATLSDLESSRSALKEQQRRVQVLAALTKLRLLACHPRLYDRTSEVPSSKLARLLDLVDELTAEGHRTLIFSQFTSHLALVREALEARGLTYLELDGSTAPRARAARVKAFQAGTAPLFLISLKAGGVGLNLTAATNVIHLDPWWNPAVEDQASDRAHRLGQTKPVTIYRLVSLGTLEEEMLRLHADKRALVAKVLAGKSQAARVTTEELLKLLAPTAHPTAE